MNTKEIERAIVQLPSSEIAKLAEWFREFQAQVWDQQLESDVQAGRLDTLLEQAGIDFQSGRCQPYNLTVTASDPLTLVRGTAALPPNQS